jgi:ATP-dependent DNA helicase RecQ
MSAEGRRRTQDAFSREAIDVIVATVAFGMGIDRSDVRCVLHAAMPRSIEHYQQETGRAGRDGLEAECVLLYSPADVLRWKSLLDKNAAEAGDSATAAAAEAHLEEMRRFCAPGRCRHALLSEHFGQPYGAADCGACDVCLGECEELEDGTEPARMILSCVARTGQRFGAGHVVDVLRGSENDRIFALRHHELGTYGLLAKRSKKELTSLVYQLVDQGLLDRTGGDYPVLVLNDASWQVLRGDRSVRFLPTAPAGKRRVRKTAFARDSWEGVDADLFQSLRDLRAEIALERGVPPYVIFNDASLRDMARRKPSDRESFLAVHGVGRKKLEDLGERFLARIAACRGPGL